jgi:hypothetical protein
VKNRANFLKEQCKGNLRTEQWRENPHHSREMDNEKWLWRLIRALRSSFGTPASSRSGARPGMAAAAKP